MVFRGFDPRYNRPHSLRGRFTLQWIAQRRDWDRGEVLKLFLLLTVIVSGLIFVYKPSSLTLNKESIMMKKYSILIIAIILAGMFSVTGCLERYGMIKRNTEVLQLFTHRTALPDYNYYYSGLDIPSAVIGIDKNYRFSDRLWVKIESKQEVHDKISRLRYASVPSTLLGGDIVDKNNRKVGIWFSYYHRTVVTQDPEGILKIYTQPNELRWDEDIIKK